MAIKHEDVKITGQRGYASEWNKDHVIDGDVDFDGHAILNDTTIAIRRGTYYWSCAGQNFHARNPDTDAIFYDDDEGTLYSEADNLEISAPVFLPHGAVVTGVCIYGTGGLGWSMIRKDLESNNFVEMAAGETSVEETTITDPDIDNSNYAYWLVLWDVDNGKAVKSARIEYTL